MDTPRAIISRMGNGGHDEVGIAARQWVPQYDRLPYFYSLTYSTGKCCVNDWVEEAERTSVPDMHNPASGDA